MNLVSISYWQSSIVLDSQENNCSKSNKQMLANVSRKNVLEDRIE